MLYRMVTEVIEYGVLVFTIFIFFFGGGITADTIFFITHYKTVLRLDCFSAEEHKESIAISSFSVLVYGEQNTL